MKLFHSSKIVKITSYLAVILLLLVMHSPIAYAATSPGLGLAKSFTILSGTYVNTAPGTTINGDLGYTTGPAVTPTVNGTTHGADAVYAQAGIDQNSALSALNSQPCTFNFAPGAVDLATDATHGTIGVYQPGVYCITGAGNAVVGGTITLSGSGTYIFRMDGAYTTAANSNVVLANGASPCDVWWTPTGATTLGANSTMAGTDIDASGITIGSTVTWTGRALAFGGTVSTNVDTMSAPTCTTTTSSSSGSGSSGTSGGGGGVPPCIAPVITSTPIIITSRRINANSVSLSWGPYEGQNTFIVQYGFADGQFSFSTRVTGFSITLNSLPSNVPIWVRVATTNNCMIGNYSESKLIGSPILPNSGVDPRSLNFPYNVFSEASNTLTQLFHFFSL